MVRAVLGALLIALAVTLAVPVGAQTTQYVSDELQIARRSGAGTQYKILEFLTSGTRLQVLQSNGDGWSRIRTPDGEVGWVQTQYLMDRPGARQLLSQARNELESVRQENDRLREQLAATESKLQDAEARIAELEEQQGELEAKVSRSSEGLELYDENQRLKKEVIDLKRQIQEMETEMARLSDRNRQDWFLVGAGVIVAGMFLGIILTRIRWRKRSTWGDRL